MERVWLNWLGLIAVGAVAALAILEAVLRSLFGFGNPLTYLADPEIGYLLSPNQTTRRFGKLISINQYSMRSPDVAPTRAAKTLRILLIGDSIVNGGWWTDQDKTLSTLLQRQLQDTEKIFDRVEVLNASANSWSPRNELAYLQRFGTFESQIVVQVINTDDLFGIAPYSVVVGRDPNYPDRKPPLAIAEVLSRYLSKPVAIPELNQLQQEGGDRVAANLEAIRQTQAIAAQNNAQLLLVITPLLREVENGSRSYERTARERLSNFTQQQQIPFIDILPTFVDDPNFKAHYIDSIHLSQTGNLQVVQQISQEIQQIDTDL
ncbi:SGNH/GDSL hydrolase family protein [Phormidium tenue FACHB-886]|nr:SGNH/GDSL hydrolase family protein [Phormidium tenue FACHB-886]